MHVTNCAFLVVAWRRISEHTGKWQYIEFYKKPRSHQTTLRQPNRKDGTYFQHSSISYCPWSSSYSVWIEPGIRIVLRTEWNRNATFVVNIRNSAKSGGTSNELSSLANGTEETNGYRRAEMARRLGEKAIHPRRKCWLIRYVKPLMECELWRSHRSSCTINTAKIEICWWINICLTISGGKCASSWRYPELSPQISPRPPWPPVSITTPMTESIPHVINGVDIIALEIEVCTKSRAFHLLRNPFLHYIHQERTETLVDNLLTDYWRFAMLYRKPHRQNQPNLEVLTSEWASRLVFCPKTTSQQY